MLALLSLLAVPGAAAPAAAQGPDYYICRIDRQGSRGGISWTMVADYRHRCAVPEDIVITSREAPR
jgi:hypothetical protein